MRRNVLLQLLQLARLAELWTNSVAILLLPSLVMFDGNSHSRPNLRGQPEYIWLP